MNAKQRRDADYDQREAALKEGGITIERKAYGGKTDYHLIDKDGGFCGCYLQRGAAIKNAETILQRQQQAEQRKLAEHNLALESMQNRAAKFSRLYHHGYPYVRENFTFKELAKLLYDMVSFGGDDTRQSVKDVINALDNYHG